MPRRPEEVTEPHSRLLRVTLEEDNSREYWRRPQARQAGPGRVEAAFSGFWFGSRSMPRIRDLLTNFDARFGAYPHALAALAEWSTIDRDTRLLVCHWHVQLSDPLYREFTGVLCPSKREGEQPLTRDAVVRWLRSHDPHERWGATTHVQFASKLLSCAHAVGLVTTIKDPRPLGLPRVTHAALGYLLHLLRGVEFAGSLHDNPYLYSVGLVGGLLDERVRTLPGVSLRRVANLVDLHFDHDSALEWVRATQTEHAA
jgi:hypothetical protein